MGFEPPTSALPARRSSQLSYSPRELEFARECIDAWSSVGEVEAGCVCPAPSNGSGTAAGRSATSTPCRIRLVEPLGDRRPRLTAPGARSADVRAAVLGRAAGLASSSTSRTTPSPRVSRTLNSNGARSSSSRSSSTGWPKFIEKVARPSANRCTFTSSHRVDPRRRVLEAASAARSRSAARPRPRPARRRRRPPRPRAGSVPTGGRSSPPSLIPAIPASSVTRCPSSSRSFVSSRHPLGDLHRVLERLHPDPRRLAGAPARGSPRSCGRSPPISAVLAGSRRQASAAAASRSRSRGAPAAAPRARAALSRSSRSSIARLDLRRVVAADEHPAECLSSPRADNARARPRTDGDSATRPLVQSSSRRSASPQSCSSRYRSRASGVNTCSTQSR